MSLSDTDDLFAHEGETTTSDAWGTVFTPHGETALQSIERIKSTQWTREEVEAYLEKVKSKATAMASKILTDAKAEALALKTSSEAEAARIQEEAHKQGYDKGYAEGHDEAYKKTMAEADEELEALRSGMADAVSGVLSNIEGQCSHIFDTWRDDLIAVCRMAVEKIAPVQLSEERSTLLASLFTESVNSLERGRQFVIYVNPEDEPVITDIMESTRSKYPDATVWQVKTDPQIAPGGLVVESESSLAESRVEARKAAVDAVLAHLTLPETP